MFVSFKAIGRNIRAAHWRLISRRRAADRLKISQLHFGRLGRANARFRWRCWRRLLPFSMFRCPPCSTAA